MERTNGTTMRPAGRMAAPVALCSRALVAGLLAIVGGVGGIGGIAGCGSGGAGGPSDGGPRSDVGGFGAAAVTWTESGTPHTASFATAVRTKTSVSDLVMVTGSDATGAAVSFGVGDTPPLVLGSYACGDSGTGRRVVSIAYVLGSASSLVPTCTIEIMSLGETTGSHVVGRFTASLPLTDGTTHPLTDGKFDVALTVQSL